MHLGYMLRFSVPFMQTISCLCVSGPHLGLLVDVLSSGRSPSLHGMCGRSGSLGIVR